MGTVDLNNRLNDTLFYRFHSVEFFIKNPAGFLRINCFKVVILPLNIHHNGQCTLSVASLFRRYLMRAGNCKISSRPETDIVRQGSACAGHKISDALNACQLHLIPCFFLIFILNNLCRCTACKKSLDHKLKKSVLCGKFRAAAKSSFTNLINCITILFILS